MFQGREVWVNWIDLAQVVVYDSNEPWFFISKQSFAYIEAVQPPFHFPFVLLSGSASGKVALLGDYPVLYLGVIVWGSLHYKCE